MESIVFFEGNARRKGIEHGAWSRGLEVGGALRLRLEAGDRGRKSEIREQKEIRGQRSDVRRQRTAGSNAQLSLR
ncbi:MAG: hypothetical protein DRG34_03040 [Deltaproteobacteria bacterium]|nr:MAG: hypothetical protein DRG34_03040 [Deltaproteobacteria bacterium]